MADFKVISADDHVFEPPDLWTSRLEAKFQHRAPRIVRLDNGADWWVSGDREVLTMTAGGTQAGVRFDDPDRLSFLDTHDNVLPGGYLPDERIKDMATDGVEVSVIYPTVAFQFYKYPADDGDFVTACFRAYNDWMAEFCGAHPKRLKGIAMVNLVDIREGVKELERCANLGYVGAMITVYPPEEKAYNSPDYEPFWAAAQDLEIPISLHAGTAQGEFEMVSFGTQAHQCNPDHYVRMSLAHIIFTGVFERYPKLQMGTVEHELSWIPHFLDRLDYTYQQRARRDIWYRFKEAMLPSQYFHRNVFCGFQEDSLGIRLREIIGLDNLQWGSDYPHHESTWPRSREILDQILEGCTEEEKAKIAGGNAVRVYRLDTD